MNSSRRRFLIRSFAAAGMVVTGKLLWIESEEFIPKNLTEGDNWLFLNPDDRLILAMLTPVLLDGVLSSTTNQTLSGVNLVRYLKAFDFSLTLLPQAQQKEFKALLSTLHSLVGRVVMAGVWSRWNNVSAATIDTMLNHWRQSYFDLLKVAYTGLKELSYATWYGSPESWQGIGYPGPPELLR